MATGGIRSPRLYIYISFVREAIRYISHKLTYTADMRVYCYLTIELLIIINYYGLRFHIPKINSKSIQK